MRRIYSIIFTIFLLSAYTINAQDVFQRTSQIPAPPEGGFGNMISGVDFDGDGKTEVYAVSNNYVDRPEELIPKIWKFEWNGTSWDSVWGATLDIPLQNTWPPMAYGDVDKDGKMEIWWGPINFLDASTNPNPARIVVFEEVGDGSDNMGVDVLGTFIPNAQWTITPEDNFNLRPHKFVLTDFDGDGTTELVFCDRAGTYHYGVVSVNNIPDDAAGNEVWELEASGKDDGVLTATGNKWDFALLENRIVLFAQNGKVYNVKNDGGIYSTLPVQNGFANEGASFKSAVTVDLNNDGTKEILMAEWWGPRVWLLQVVNDTLSATQIADLAPLGADRLNGGGYGDIDGDGKPDYVFGSRYTTLMTAPNNSVYRVEYQGGDITSPASYEAQIIDSLLNPGGVGGDIDAIYLANMDGDAADEVFYTAGYSRGDPNDLGLDIAVVDKEYTISVRNESSLAPDNFYVEQNYPNPFNPSTTIRFGISSESTVNLVVYDLLGREVMTAINGERMSSGVYTVTIDASALASGTYIYKLTAGDYQVSKKMILMK